LSIILIGFKKVGKSTIGKQVADRMQLPFIDTDERIGDCSAIYEKYGEEVFRKRERDVLLSLESQPSIIATGGGAILTEENVQTLKKIGKLIYLYLSQKTLQERIVHTPSFLKNISFEAHFSSREPLYRKAADKIIDLEGLTEEAAICRVITLATFLGSLRGENRMAGLSG